MTYTQCTNCKKYFYSRYGSRFCSTYCRAEKWRQEKKSRAKRGLG